MNRENLGGRIHMLGWLAVLVCGGMDKPIYIALFGLLGLWLLWQGAKLAGMVYSQSFRRGRKRCQSYARMR